MHTLEQLSHIMPWVVSVFLHVGLVLVFLFITMFIMTTHIPEDIHVPGTVLAQNSALVQPVTKAQVVNKEYKRTENQSYESKKETGISAIDGKINKEVLMIGSSNAGGKLKKLPWGKVHSDILFRPPTIAGNIHHIVYVIDRSGSMVEIFDTVNVEMCKSISYLSREQYFHVVLFSSGKPLEHMARRLVLALPIHKQLMAKFLENIKPGGKTDPIPSLQRAFKVLDGADTSDGKTGKLIFLLTDGNFPDNNKVLAEVRKLNRNKKVLINTYLYGHRPPEAEIVMKKIAEENNGIYKYVSQDE